MYFNILLQRFDWPVGRAVEDTEVLVVELFVRGRVFADKLLGTYGLVLQSVIRDGRLSVSDNLVDPNNKPLPVSNIEYFVTHSTFVVVRFIFIAGKNKLIYFKRKYLTNVKLF